MEINTNCVRCELPKVRVICDSVINSSIAFLFLWSLFEFLALIAAMNEI